MRSMRALWDLEAKRTGTSVWELAGIRATEDDRDVRDDRHPFDRRVRSEGTRAVALSVDQSEGFGRSAVWKPWQPSVAARRTRGWSSMRIRR
jgi:L-alanine-DL-glutamate epimerase-like enolase superfamily enzyme